MRYLPAFLFLGLGASGRSHVVDSARCVLKLLSFIVLLTVGSRAVGQPLTPQVQKLVRRLETAEQLDHKHVSNAGITSNNYYNFLELRKKASQTELLTLVDHVNPIVKGYAAWALADRKYGRLAEVFAKFRRSGEMVDVLSGCIGHKSHLSAQLYQRVNYQCYENELSKPDSLFFISQRKILDSVILYSDVDDDHLLHDALEYSDGNRRDYARIRYWALTVHHPAAIEALAGYQQQEDIPAFLELGEQSFLAIARFPDAAFWPFLVSKFKENPSAEYLMALAAFQSEASANELRRLLVSMKPASIEPLSEAINTHYCSRYRRLVEDIWRMHQVIDLSSTKQLIRDAPEGAADVFAEMLLSGKELHFVVFRSEYGSEQEILPLMLAHIGKFSREQLLAVCLSRIAVDGFMELETVLRCAVNNRLPEVCGAALQRLEKTDMAFEMYHLAETVLMLGNTEQKGRLLPTLERGRAKWDQGNWSETFTQLLKKHQLVAGRRS